MTDPIDPETLHQMARELAQEIADTVLIPKQPIRSTVVIDAMALLYEFHARLLPPHGISMCATHLEELAHELRQTSIAMQLQATCTTAKGTH